jgi:hypothetical protein
MNGRSNYNQTNRVDQGSKDVCSWYTIHNYIYNPTKHCYITDF